MAVVIRNTTSADAPPAAPVKDDGRPYRYEMIFAGATRRAYADTMAELVDALSPGYASLATDRERDEARVSLALDAQVRVQADVAASGRLRDCTDDERTLILGGRHEPPSPATWKAPVPLVLITSFYQPYGALPRPAGPAGQQIWLDPGDDRSLLTTLHAAGFVQVGMRSAEPEPFNP